MTAAEITAERIRLFDALAEHALDLATEFDFTDKPNPQRAKIDPIIAAFRALAAPGEHPALLMWEARSWPPFQHGWVGGGEE